MLHRPAALQLPHPVVSASATPDGSCLVVLERLGEQTALRAFHWTSFGSNNIGYPCALSMADSSSFSLTSVKTRSIIYATFTVTSADGAGLVSQRLRISKEASEFQFRANQASHRETLSSPAKSNVLLDVWNDLWIKFPVESAIQRNNLSSDWRQPPTFTVVNELGHSLTQPLQSYWRKLVRYESFKM